MLVISRYTFLALVLLLEKGQMALNSGDGIQPRIVNGTIAMPGQFPFAVSLQLSSFQRHKCTLSLITSKTCLGAAHCAFLRPNFSPIPKDQICGIVGSVQQAPWSTCHNFSEIYVHEEFRRDSLINDIATFIFSEEMKIDKKIIDVVPLIASGSTIPETSVTLIGWGFLYSISDVHNPVSQRYLRFVELDLLPNKNCRTTEKNLCLETIGKGPCFGDSGGPNVISHSGKLVQIGITSHIFRGCARGKSVLVFVGSYNDWIKTHSIGDPVFVSVQRKVYS